MFNDILTGKAAPEGGARDEDPYRAPGEVADPACTTCGKTLPTAELVFGRCPDCSVKAKAALDAVLAQTQPQSQAYSAMVEAQRSRDQSATVIKWVVCIVITIGLAMFRYGMRASQEADMREMDYGRQYDSDRYP